MIIRADKKKILEEFQEKYIKDRFTSESEKIIKKYQTDKNHIDESIMTEFDLICKEAIKLQERNLKGKIKFIYFSFLRTNLFENKGQWRIDLYDEKWYLDNEECSININLDFVYESLFNHMDELLERKKEYGRNITELDIEKIKLKEAEKYTSLAIEAIKGMIECFIKNTSYKEMEKTEDIRFMAGEYRDFNILLYSEN